MRRSARANAAIFSKEPSRLPSSTKTISQVRPAASSAFTRRSFSSSRLSASLKTGQDDGDLGRARRHDGAFGSAAGGSCGGGGGAGGGEPAGYCRRKTVTQTAPIGLLPSWRSHASRVKR